MTRETIATENLHHYLQKLYDSFPKNATLTDVVINPNGLTFGETNEGKVLNLGRTLSNTEIVRIGTLLASLSGSRLSYSHPRVSASLDNSEKRFEILIPPAVESASLSLRLHHRALFSLDDLQKRGMLTEREAVLLKAAVKARKNIVISGETGAGKTTLLSSLINTIDESERIVIIEDGSSEINCKLPNSVKIVANNTSITGRDAVKASLRMNPDRIIYGEVRDGNAAYETLKAWHTGHNGGLSTIHAGGAHKIYDRFYELLNEVTTSESIEMVRNTVDVCVHCAFENGRRFVKEILM